MRVMYPLCSSSTKQATTRRVGTQGAVVGSIGSLSAVQEAPLQRCATLRHGVDDADETELRERYAWLRKLDRGIQTGDMPPWLE